MTDLAAKIRGLTAPSEEMDARAVCALLAPEGSTVEQSPINGAWCIYAPRAYGPRTLWGGYSPGRGVTRSITFALDLAELVTQDKVDAAAVLASVLHDFRVDPLQPLSEQLARAVVAKLLEGVEE